MKKLNIGVIAHVDAGKTTLTENILFHGGVIKETGRVDKGSTTTDNMAVERRRGISVRAAATTFVVGDITYNLIDTPGHVDFVAEVERSLVVLDGVVMVVSAVEGLQSQTRVLMDTIRAFGIPAIVFINKIDRVGADALGVIADVNKYLGEHCVITQSIDSGSISFLSNNELMDKNSDLLFDLDEELMDRFVQNQEIDYALFSAKLHRYTREGQIYPVFFGSALYGIGCKELFDALPIYLPTREYRTDDSLSAFVFKVDTTAAERHSYVRIFTGSISLRDIINCKGKEEKITRLARLDGSKVVSCQTLEAGDIGIMYLKSLKAGDIVGETPPIAHKISLARPTMVIEAKPAKTEQRRALYEALVQLADEDPLLGLSSGKKVSLRLLGEVQKEVITEILSERFGIDVEFSEAQTVYMETPATEASSVYPIYKIVHYAAGAGFTVKPLPRGSGFKYIAKVSLGELTKTFQNAVEEAVYETCKHGIYGWEITDCEVIFDYSDYDSVNGTPSAYRDIVPLVLIEAFANAGMNLIEPYLDFELRIPTDAVSRALYELSRMNVNIEDTSPAGEFVCIAGDIPADKCKNYGASVGAYTEGRGVWLTRFKGYRDTIFEDEKINHDEINPATNRAVYVMQKLGAM